ncbi:glycosyl hydrolase catalytic core-domain-containing protein [Protomyces lactucae-debilis]|uniref:Glycosyl hydrolase catalytic core-domain-containing protein n=1 Tax=Protomyces lactucae-debilis TaxID=2754530 RepID=A0A1Y2FJZ9_PROLT|nr:glycosyl hydrolase catalytic core-domain-containing protein [Protomyces lactucae-debilis]ORY84293.1 glycosyl hydrolase catalytic core-domain-containing protein [Protomyces lactucae-debilis]
MGQSPSSLQGYSTLHQGTNAGFPAQAAIRSIPLYGFQNTAQCKALCDADTACAGLQVSGAQNSDFMCELLGFGTDVSMQGSAVRAGGSSAYKKVDFAILPQPKSTTTFVPLVIAPAPTPQPAPAVVQPDAQPVAQQPVAVAPAPTPAPAPAQPAASKRGLDWPWNNPSSSWSLFAPSQSWVYNWELWDPRESYFSGEYVPMVRSADRVTQLSTYIPADGSRCPQHLLGFNEPDLVGSDTYQTLEGAISLWRGYFNPLRQTCPSTKLGAPAVTNGNGEYWGISWLQKFFANCNDCQASISFIPIHWYGGSAADFIQYVGQFHNAFPQYPLWVTEFAFVGISTEAYLVEFKQALQFLDNARYIERYSAFGPMNAANMVGIVAGAMVSDDERSLTAVGRLYTS